MVRTMFVSVGKSIAMIVAVSGLMALSHNAGAEDAGEPVETDYAAWKAVKSGEDLALGPTGAIATVIADPAESESDARAALRVESVAEGSPADGVLEVGDVILGLPSSVAESRTGGEARFGRDVRKDFSAAITEAEKKQNGGRLVLHIWRKGQTHSVVLKLAVMGSYSATSPWECEKTRAIVDASCQSIIKHRFSAK
ncbi:MAG: DUF6288 domain-containing protein, partial [Pirellulales bacterium]